MLRGNIYNMDETDIMLSMLGSVKVLVGKDDLRNYRGVGVKRTMITAVECISCGSRYLHPLIIWLRHTHRSNWTTYPTPGWHYVCTESGYTNSKISLEWLARVFSLQTKERAATKLRVLVCDGFQTRKTLEFLHLCLEGNIRPCRTQVPPHRALSITPGRWNRCHRVIPSRTLTNMGRQLFEIR